MDFLKALLFMMCEMAPYILLGFLIAGIMHAFVSQRAMSRHLSGRGWRPVVKAALLGVPLPLCSCGVLPTAIAMRRSGASKAASTSFLIATPQTGVDSIAATWSLLGPAFAVIRPVAALFTSFFGGMAVGAVEKQSTPVDAPQESATVTCAPHRSFGQKALDALRYGFVDLTSSIGGWLVAGLLIAAAITVYVPDGYFTMLGRTPILSMLAVLIVAIPMYVCATGSIPIALSLMLKGLSPGTALVLLMAGPAANFASFTLISREMGRRPATLYLAAIITGAIFFGLIIDYLLPARWFIPSMATLSCHSSELPGIFPSICAAILAILLLTALIRNSINNHQHFHPSTMATIYKVTGMNCPHCQATVKKSIESVAGVTAVDVNLSSGIATVQGAHNPTQAIRAVRDAGFDIQPME